MVIETEKSSPYATISVLLKTARNKPPEIFDSLKRGNFLLVLLPRVVADIFIIPQSPAVLQRMFNGIIDG